MAALLYRSVEKKNLGKVRPLLLTNPLNPSGHYIYRTMVTICTAQWSLYVPHSGHYMYRQWSLYIPASGHYMYRTMVTICAPVVTICTTSGHYMYRTVVTICTGSGNYMYRQWSLYIPPVVTICTAQWSLYVPPVVTVCTASLTFSNSTFCPHSVFMCFVWI